MILQSLLLIGTVLLARGMETDLMIEYTGNVIKVTVNRSQITISDNANESLSCKWNTEGCYAKCTTLNITLNLSLPFQDTICANSTPNKLHFKISTSECEVTICKEENFMELLKGKDDLLKGKEDLQLPEDLKRILIMKSMCSHLFNITRIKQAYINLERLMIKQLIEKPFEGEDIIYNLTDLAVTVAKINLTAWNPNEKYMHITAPMLSYEDRQYTPQTWIPCDIFQNMEKRKVGVVLYQSAEQFWSEKDRPQSMLIRVELVEDSSARNLMTPLRMQFKLMDKPAALTSHIPQCQFYSEWKYETWTDEGCVTHIVVNNTVECSCDHMTPFAVLLVPTDSASLSHWKILSIISYIGSGLSAFFTAVSILTYFIIRSPSRDHSTSIHVSLSGALYMLNLSFLVNEWLANMRMHELCVFIAITMHYSLLCSFTWMAIEAVHLYLLIIKVFNTYVRHYIAKLSLIGWGIPAVIVGVSFAATYESNLFYGHKEIRLENSTSVLCWITDERFFYGLNVSYFAIVFLFNNGILLTVSARICKMRKFGKKSGMTVPWKDACTVLGLTCLLGTTWGLAFISYGPLSVPILYLFSIFNSLQGFLIFLWICGTSRKERRNAKSTSAGTLNSNTKPRQTQSMD